MMHPPLLWIVYSMEKSNTLSISWRVLKSNIWSIWFKSCVRSTNFLRIWGSEIEDEYSDLLFCPYSRRLSLTGLISLDLYLLCQNCICIFRDFFKNTFFQTWPARRFCCTGWRVSTCPITTRQTIHIKVLRKKSFIFILNFNSYFYFYFSSLGKLFSFKVPKKKYIFFFTFFVSFFVTKQTLQIQV